METTKKVKLIDNKPEIPNKIFGVNLDKDDKERLMNNQYTSLLHNIDVENGVKKDGKIKLVKNRLDEYEFAFLFKHRKLEIPEEIEGHKLNENEIHDLLNGHDISIMTKDKEKINIKIDNELNRIVVALDNKIRVPEKIGEYKLTKEETELMKNGEQLPNHLFKNENNYFSANVKFNADKTGLVFSNIKTLTLEQAKEHKDFGLDQKENSINSETVIKTGIETLHENKLNKERKEGLDISDKDESMNIESVIATGVDSLKNKGKHINIEQSQIDQQIKKHISDKNYIGIYNLQSEGKTASKSLKDEIINDKNLSVEEKKGLAEILNINVDKKELKKVPGTKIGEQKTEMEKEKILKPSAKKDKTKDKIKDKGKDAIQQTERIVTSMTREL